MSTTVTPLLAPAIDGVSLLDKLDRFVSSPAGVEQARVYPVTIPGVSRLPPTMYDDVAFGVTTGVTPVTPSTVLSTIVQTDDFVVLPGPEDVLLLNTTTGLYQQSVTLTARMYPIEATAAKSIWGLPTLIWGILIGTVVILLLILATLFFCCWLQPRTRKLLNSSYYTTTTNNGNASQSSIVAKSCTSSSDSNQLVMPLSIGICPPQYSAPPPPQQSQQSQQGTQSHHGSTTGGSNSSLHHASHGASVHHTCNAATSSSSGSVPIGGVCNMASGSGHDYAHVKYGSSPQQQQQQQYSQQQYGHHHHPQQQQQQQHHQHQCIHYQQQYNQQLQQQQQQHSQHQHGHHVHGQHGQQQQQYSPYNHQQYYHHPAQHTHQQQQYLHYQQHQQQHHQQQQREHHHQHHSQQSQQQHQHQHHQSSSSHHQSPQQQQQQQQQQGQLVHSQMHKSMWAINPLYASSGVISDENEGDTSTSYRTRSLPSWGKNKQRPLSNADDLEELYAKVNFSKKRRNRMRNDEAAIIALCRSRSQNLAALPLGTDQDAVVVYDERTAL